MEENKRFIWSCTKFLASILCAKFGYLVDNPFRDFRVCDLNLRSAVCRAYLFDGDFPCIKRRKNR